MTATVEHCHINIINQTQRLVAAAMDHVHDATVAHSVCTRSCIAPRSASSDPSPVMISMRPLGAPFGVTMKAQGPHPTTDDRNLGYFEERDLQSPELAPLLDGEGKRAATFGLLTPHQLPSCELDAQYD